MMLEIIAVSVMELVQHVLEMGLTNKIGRKISKKLSVRLKIGLAIETRGIGFNKISTMRALLLK